MLEQHGKLHLESGVTRWTDTALAVPGIFLLSLTSEIAIESAKIPPPMHKDPAERILVATSMVERLTLVTADKAVLAFARIAKLANLKA